MIAAQGKIVTKAIGKPRLDALEELVRKPVDQLEAGLHAILLQGYLQFRQVGHVGIRAAEEAKERNGNGKSRQKSHEHSSLALR